MEECIHGLWSRTLWFTFPIRDLERQAMINDENKKNKDFEWNWFEYGYIVIQWNLAQLKTTNGHAQINVLASI